MIYRDDVERVHEVCVALERELAIYRSFGDVSSVAAVEETARTRREVRSLVPAFGWLLIGVAASVFVARQASSPVSPATVLFWAASFVLVHTLFRTRALRHQLARRARTLAFEQTELTQALSARVGWLPERTALDTSIAKLHASLARDEPRLAVSRRRHAWTGRFFDALVSSTAVSSAVFLWCVHRSMNETVGNVISIGLAGFFGALVCGVSAAVVWLKVNEAEEAHHALLDSVAQDRRRLSLRTSERQLVVSGEDPSAMPRPGPTPA